MTPEQQRLSDALGNCLSPEAICLAVAYLQTARCRDGNANKQVAWLADTMLEMLGVPTYNRLMDQIGL